MHELYDRASRKSVVWSFEHAAGRVFGTSPLEIARSAVRFRRAHQSGAFPRRSRRGEPRSRGAAESLRVGPKGGRVNPGHLDPR